eukprot:jgi/Psemu1/18745/gm1.18745_g
MPTFTNRFFQTLGAVTYPAFYIMRNNDWWRQNERWANQDLESSSSSSSSSSESEDSSTSSFERHRDAELVNLRRQATEAEQQVEEINALKEEMRVARALGREKERRYEAEMNNQLHPNGNISDYINTFELTYHKLRKIPPYHMTEWDAKSIFARNIRDPNLERFKEELLEHKTDRTLEEIIIFLLNPVR